MTAGEQRTDGASLLRDSSWATWTCALGWPVQGIWPKFADGTDINAVARSFSGHLVATADDFGRVTLFRYPCVTPHSGCVSLEGHASHVTNLAWSRSDTCLVSVGGRDRGVFQWANRGVPDGGEPDVDPDAAMHAGEEALAEDLADAPAHGAAVAAARAGAFFELEEGAEREACLGHRQWHSACIAPAERRAAVGPNVAPEAELELEWVHGFSARRGRSQVGALATGEVVYPVAAVAVVRDVAGNRQRFFREHTDDITCLAVHPTGTVVATGQMGADPCVFVWDAVTGRVLRKLGGFHRRAVTALAFSADGNYLATTGQDDQHSVALYDWKEFTGRVVKRDSRQMLASQGMRVARGGTRKLLDVAYHPGGHWFVAVGVRVVKFFNAHTMAARRGIIGDKGKLQPFLCCAVFAGVAVVGTADGSLYVRSVGEHWRKACALSVGGRVGVWVCGCVRVGVCG